MMKRIVTIIPTKVPDGQGGCATSSTSTTEIWASVEENVLQKTTVSGALNFVSYATVIIRKEQDVPVGTMLQIGDRYYRVVKKKPHLSNNHHAVTAYVQMECMEAT